MKRLKEESDGWADKAEDERVAFANAIRRSRGEGERGGEGRGGFRLRERHASELKTIRMEYGTGWQKTIK